jgi:signal transduction histidine kinase
MDSHAEIIRLRARVTELEREMQAVEGFTAMAAHELLTPVVMMDACAATLSERLHGDRRHADSRRDLDAMRRGAARSRLLAETLLNHAAVHARPLQRRRIELGTLVGDCLALLEPEIRGRDVAIAAGPLPTLAVDEPLFSSVFMNLLVNALKYGPRQGGTVGIDAVRADRGWRIGIESDGEVIPAGDRERIFEPYRRGRGERRVRGSGLGLAICREIVGRHGGEVGVRPGAAGGNRFHFTLPG